MRGRHLAKIGIRSLLKICVTRTRTQLYVAENFDKCRIMDGAGEVHAQLINCCLHRHIHTHNYSRNLYSAISTQLKFTENTVAGKLKETHANKRRTNRYIEWWKSLSKMRKWTPKIKIKNHSVTWHVLQTAINIRQIAIQCRVLFKFYMHRLLYQTIDIYPGHSV